MRRVVALSILAILVVLMSGQRVSNRVWQHQVAGATNNCETAFGGTFTLFLTASAQDVGLSSTYHTHATKEYPADVDADATGAQFGVVANTDPTDNDPLNTGNNLYDLDYTDASGSDYISFVNSTTNILPTPGDSFCMMTTGYLESTGTALDSHIWDGGGGSTFGDSETGGEDNLDYIQFRYTNALSLDIAVRFRPQEAAIFANSNPDMLTKDAFMFTFYGATDCGTNPCTGSATSAQSEWSLFQEIWDGTSGSFSALADGKVEITRNDTEEIDVASTSFRFGDVKSSITTHLYIEALTFNVCSGADDTCLCLCDPNYTGCDAGEDDWGNVFYVDGDQNCEADFTD